MSQVSKSSLFLFTLIVICITSIKAQQIGRSKERICQQQWIYSKLDSTIKGEVVFNQPTRVFCGSEQAASNTLIKLSSGDTVRILELCDMDTIKVGQIVTITPSHLPIGRISLIPIDPKACSILIAYWGNIVEDQ